jgi:hypothetical protein
MQHTRELHIVSGELNILKRTLTPLFNMINALRDHRPTPKRSIGATGINTGNSPQWGTVPPEYDEKTHGADISVAARVYLADVADHVLILTEEIDMLRGTVENMINMVPSPFSLINSDFQYGSFYAKRIYATAHDGIPNISPINIHNGILWYEF